MSTTKTIMLTREQTARCYGVSVATVTKRTDIRVVTPVGVNRWLVPISDMLSSQDVTIRDLARRLLLEEQVVALKGGEVCH